MSFGRDGTNGGHAPPGHDAGGAPARFFTPQDARGRGWIRGGCNRLAQLDGRLAKTFQDSALQNSKPIKEGATFFRFMGQPVPEIAGRRSTSSAA
jgi:hypothetical protein